MVKIPSLEVALIISEYSMYALMTSVGGYLGLFIGLSLGDVCISIVDTVVKFFTSTSKHRG